MTQEERDVLAHLAADWDAQAAQIERQHDPDHAMWRKAYALRECAGQLRDRLLKLRTPVPHVIREGTLVSWGSVLDPPWPKPD